MFTSKQVDAITNFFDANQKLFEALYNFLIEIGTPTDVRGAIIAETNDIHRSLLCKDNNCDFSSCEKTIDNVYYRSEESKTYGHFSILFGQGNIDSNGTNTVCVDKCKDGLSLMQGFGDIYEEVDIVEFYELTMKHIENIQNEINTFAHHFGLTTFDLQSISKFLSTEIIGEQIPKRPTDMKLKDYGFTTIVASAIRKGDYVILGFTHSDCYNKIGKNANVPYSDLYDKSDYVGSFESGYITSDGVFVMPGEAWQIAEKAGQIDENVQSFTYYSENFYSSCGKEFDIIYARKRIQDNFNLMVIERLQQLKEMVFGENTHYDKQKLQNQYCLGLMDDNFSISEISEIKEKIRVKILKSIR